MLQSLFAIASPFGFGADGHVELGISEFQVWHHAGQGVPDPDVKRMGFFITTSEAQTLLEFDLSQVWHPTAQSQLSYRLLCVALLMPRMCAVAAG